MLATEIAVLAARTAMFPSLAAVLVTMLASSGLHDGALCTTVQGAITSR